jgi:7-cyano-7-deazaguanine synthase
MKKAIVLLSGGLDSTVVLALALSKQRNCLALSFDYQQKHRVELEAAKNIAKHYAVELRTVAIHPSPFTSSSLVAEAEVCKNRSLEEMQTQGIPSSYVPARNTIFLSYALGFAEAFGAEEIYFGANAMDRFGYPDCRPAYLQAFQALMNVATKQAVEGLPPQLVTPLLDLDKAEIIRQGFALNAPLELTMSCYNPLGLYQPCHQCDACVLRAAGYQKAMQV